jgi:O-antigen biosynthesis protein
MTPDKQDHDFTVAGDADFHRASAELDFANAQIESLKRRIASIEGSGSGRLAHQFSRVIHRAAPAGTRRRRVIGGTLRSLTALRSADVAEALRSWRHDGSGLPPLGLADLRWNRFCARADPNPARLQRMRELSRSWPDRPLVSILMPTYDADPDFLRAAIESVRSQTYERWELCIVDDGSSTGVATETVALYRADQRVRFSARTGNSGIAAASNAAADMAAGAVITLLDHDDVLRPHALFEIVHYLRSHPDCDLVYSDEDKLDPFGRRLAPHLKPDWSPELLESCNYIGHLTAIRADLFARVGGFREGFDGSQDYDLFLRCSESANEVGHIREVLYSWRMHEGSAAGGDTAKPYAYLAAIRCLESRLERCGDEGTVTDGAWKGLYHVRRTVTGAPRVAAVIPAHDSVELLRRSVACVEREGAARDVRIVIVDHGNPDAAVSEYLSQCGHTVVTSPETSSVSHMFNLGVAAAGPVDHVLLLQQKVISGRPGWLDALLQHSQMDEVGAVGARIIFDDGSPPDDGLRVGGQGVPAQVINLSDYFGMGLATRTVAAVSADCLLVKQSLWQQMGGFDDAYQVALADVDFCMRLARGGYRNVHTPEAEFLASQRSAAATRGAAEDKRLFTTRWGPFPQGCDRFIGGHIRSFTPIAYR